MNILQNEINNNQDIIKNVDFELCRSKDTNNNFVLCAKFFQSDLVVSKIDFISTKSEFIDIKYSCFEHYLCLMEKFKDPYCCDVQPINGIWNKKMSRFLKNTINQNVVKNIEKQISCSKNDYDKIEKINLFVLDIKDQKKGYENTKQIEFSEECFAKFLQGLEPTDDTPRKLFHKIVHANRINFFMREGRLKSHLIQHHVTKEQAAFLQTNETGRMRFCQLCELIMNFFKIGFKIQNFENKNELNPSNYLLPCKFFSENKDKERIVTTKIPQLRLLTLYPIFYKNLYSKEEQYATTINKIFNIGHKYDEHTGTTAITISEKI